MTDMDKKYMNCTRCELCGTASMIYADTFIEFSILFRILAAPLAIMGSAILSAAILKAEGIHKNAKLLFIAMTTSALICNIGILVDASYKFFISNVMPDVMQCDFQVFHPEYFIGIRNIEILGSTSLSFSSLTISIERIVATVFYRTYSSTSVPILGLCLVFLQFFASILPFFFIGVPKQLYPYSTPEIHSYRIFHNLSIFSSIFNLISLSCLVVHFIAIRYRTSQKSVGKSHRQVLFSRYELQNNISTTKLTVPVIVVVSLIVFSSEMIFMRFMPEYDADTIVTRVVLQEIHDYASYAEFQLSIIPALIIIMVAVMPMLSSNLRKSFLCVSHLYICFSNHSQDSSTRSSSESSDTFASRIHWNTKVDRISPFDSQPGIKNKP